MNEEELKKATDDAVKIGFGCYDREHGVRIQPEELIFIDSDGEEKKDKMRSQIQLVQDLVALERIYKEKFGDDSPYDLALFEKDSGIFVERMIRAAEICTLNHVLLTGKGTLNKHNGSIIKGRRSFIWEH